MDIKCSPLWPNNNFTFSQCSADLAGFQIQCFQNWPCTLVHWVFWLNRLRLWWKKTRLWTFKDLDMLFSINVCFSRFTARQLGFPKTLWSSLSSVEPNWLGEVLILLWTYFFLLSSENLEMDQWGQHFLHPDLIAGFNKNKHAKIVFWIWIPNDNQTIHEI